MAHKVERGHILADDMSMLRLRLTVKFHDGEIDPAVFVKDLEKLLLDWQEHPDVEVNFGEYSLITPSESKETMGNEVEYDSDI